MARSFTAEMPNGTGTITAYQTGPGEYGVVRSRSGHPGIRIGSACKASGSWVWEPADRPEHYEWHPTLTVLLATLAEEA